MVTAKTPAKSPSRTERLEARLPAEIKAVIQRAADLSGRSLSDFVVSSAREAAEATIRQHEVITLSARDSVIFFEALLDPPEPNEALRKAFQRHRDIVGE